MDDDTPSVNDLFASVEFCCFWCGNDEDVR
jgi:hypothetical protein